MENFQAYAIQISLLGARVDCDAQCDSCGCVDEPMIRLATALPDFTMLTYLCADCDKALDECPYDGVYE